MTIAVDAGEKSPRHLSAAYVEISNGQAHGAELRSAEDVREFVAGVLAAASIAFPEDFTTDDSARACWTSHVRAVVLR